MAKMFERSLLYLSLIITLGTLLMVPCSHGHEHRRLRRLGQAKGPGDFSPITNPFVSLKYHGGPLLTAPNGINVYLIWYGGFPLADRTAIADFFASFNFVSDELHVPSVSSWWQTMRSYKDKVGVPVSGTVKLAAQVPDLYSLGKNITRAKVGNLVKNKIVKKQLPLDTNGMYIVLTSKDVAVERFCFGSCSYHGNVAVSSKTKVVFAHVGHSLRCPSLCAFPFSTSPFGRPGDFLVAPNAIGGDAMVINIATVIAGAAMNPFKTGYYGVEGYSGDKLEAVSACNGIFGAGAYPGYPGQVMVDKITNASYNVYGAFGKKFLLPAIWDLKSSSCKIA